MKKEKNNFGFIAASSICIFLLLIMIVGNFGGKGTRAANAEYECDIARTKVLTEITKDDISKCMDNDCSDGTCYFCTSNKIDCNSCSSSNCISTEENTCIQYTTVTYKNNCKAVDSSETADTCPENQYLDGTICKSCDNVLEGSTSNANSVGSKSCVCPSGKIANNNKCIDIIAGCNKYASDGKCETCLGRGTLSNGECTFSRDISNCSDYYTTNDSRYGKCKSCKTGYYVSKDLLSCTTEEEKMEYPIPTCRDTFYTGSTINFSNKLSYTSGFEIISGQSAKDVGDHKVTLRLTGSNYVWAGTSSTETSVVCKIVDPGTCDVTLSESSRTDSTISFAADITKSSDDLTIKSYDWTSSNSKVIPNFSGMNKTTAKLSGTGTTTVKLTVTLDSGKTCTSSLSVTIDKFVQPCDIKFAGTTHTAVNSSFTVSVSDSSVLPDSITGYSWSIGGATGSSISSGVSSKEVTVSKAKYYGYDNLNLTLTLKDGSTCSDTFTFKKSCDSSQTVYDNKYCCSTKTEMLGTSAECSVVGRYIGKYHNNIGILQSVEQLSAGTICRLTYNVCDNYSGPSGGGDDSGDDTGSDNGGNNGGDNGGDNGGNNGGIGGGDDTGNNNATNNPQTGSALIFVVWSIGIAMVVYAFWYFKTSKEY